MNSDGNEIMKAFYPLRRSASVFLAVIVLFGLMPLARAEIFPTELLTEQASFTNVRGAPVAISGDYLAAGVNVSLGVAPSVSVFHRENGVWQSQGMLTVPASPLTSVFGSAVALDGTNLVVGEAYDPTYWANYANGPVYVFGRSSDPTLNAWNTADDTSGAGSYYRYNHPLTTNDQNLAAIEGWTLTVGCRMVDSFGDGSSVSPSCFVDCAINSTNRFLIWFNLDTNLNLTAELYGMTNLITLTTNGDGWAEYHSHQIVFNPTNGTADYYFDGAKMNSSPWSPTPITGLDGIRFGNGSTSGRGSMNWNLVELKTHVTHQVLALYDAGTNENPGNSLDPTNQEWSLVADNHTGSGITNEPVSPDFNTAWPLQAVLRPADGISGLFGHSVAIKGDTIAVGSPGYSSDFDTESAYVFVHEGSNWVQQAQLPNAPVNYYYSGQGFGYSVDLDGDTLVIGAPGMHYSTRIGSAYVFTRSGTNWIQQQWLTNSTPETYSRFGESVSIDGDRVAIGADNASNNKGSVSIFDRTNTTWTQRGTFAPVNLPSDAQFGQTVALNGDTFVAGGFYCSRAYIFELGPTNWIEATNFLYTDSSDVSIRSVAFNGQDVVVSEGEQEAGPYGAVHIYTLNYTDANAVTNFVSKLLYPSAVATSPLFDPNQAAFRYQFRLYSEGANGALGDFTNIANYYGQAEVDRSAYAESELIKGLAFHPDDPGLGNLLLDIYYNRTEADAIFANNRLALADAAHFGPPIAPPAPSGGFLIDNEIPLYQQVLDTNRTALLWYFSLLTNHLDVAGDPPQGYSIFQNLVPGRGLMPASYYDTNGNLQSVTGNNTELFSGYKDLALLFNLLKARGDTADRMGRLLVARNEPGDADAAKALVSDTQRMLFLQGNLLKGMFSSLPPEGDPSALAEAIQGWSASLTSLAELQQILLGKVNLLGFEPDYLMFAPRGNSTISVDSFDQFLSLLNPSDSTTELGVATNKLGAALSAYAAFRGYQDEYATQAAESTSAASSRLAEIVGVPPSDPDYTNYPTGLQGSDLDQQYQSIQLARLRILKNKAEIDNVNKEVQIELSRSASVSDVIIQYGDKQASLTEQIGQLNAAQAAANQLTDYLNPENLVSGASIAIALNFGAQTIAELSKADLESQKEKLAAAEQATIEGINSAAHVKTLLLQLNTLVVDSQEAAVLMQQELGRMAALYREKARLEADLAQSKTDLSTRFFADPVHRLTTLANMETADQAFNEARKWMFYLTRAFEYKWNTTFTNYYLGHPYNSDSVLRAQNASELVDLYQALKNKDETIALNLPAPQEAQTSFSVRQDFFGYQDGQTYIDPVTGRTLSAVEAFRKQLHELVVTNLTDVRLQLEFSTVRQKAGSVFFLGARFDTNGNVVSPGRYLDKINWLKVKIVTDSNLPPSQTIGDLTYGGTSYIRKQTPGVLDLDHPDLVYNEMTAYGTRYWYFDTSLDRYRFKEAFTSSGVPIEISQTAGGMPGVLPVYDFTERSVAASGWLLSIELQDRGAEIDDINDIELFFDHRSVTRQ